ncbi:helix-turn-helix transcriptional regulator [Rhodocytophaga aerolata]|uniref:Helix-turn-helix transcriptional regulator n=1 Tax=Rhodocytophaga aerolata TaxID=455078 RepID=A0ABT8RBR8_9BACT|nr:helix-turn-helix transcriptional regulator [Rhodocytophaga aerolata]MDO1449551.1 helix-turn-helix transcriptional regulator [Rhodocytophaga aerolata]
MANYGEYFKALREAKGLTLREVERATQVSNAYLSQLESGKIKQPSPINLHKLAQLYEVRYEVLMERVGYPIPQSEDHSDLKKENPLLTKFGRITDEEEKELLGYLKFIRNRKK